MDDPGKHGTVLTVTKRVKIFELPTRAQIVMNRDGCPIREKLRVIRENMRIVRLGPDSTKM
jgi:hypothetical protein